jgi:hypothetical protein
MKSVGKDLLEIAVNFQDSADIFELKADNVFSKIKTFLLDSDKIKSSSNHQCTENY